MVSSYETNDDYDQYREQRDAEAIDRRCSVLQSLIDQLELEIGFVAPPPQADAFWSELHSTIVRTAKPRYDAQNYADSVEAALKEVNSMIKEHVRRKTGKELDGASLMQTAFSPSAPIITLDDLSTESGRNLQLGYMQIYAGAMIGIRNPKAHANISIDAKRAKHHLYLGVVRERLAAGDDVTVVARGGQDRLRARLALGDVLSVVVGNHRRHLTPCINLLTSGEASESTIPKPMVKYRIGV
jgi:uncharacterized protein (TIGR02391 family)